MASPPFDSPYGRQAGSHIKGQDGTVPCCVGSQSVYCQRSVLSYPDSHASHCRRSVVARPGSVAEVVSFGETSRQLPPVGNIS